MENKVQAIVKINGETVYYLYDEDIKDFINHWVKFKLEHTGRKVNTIETELNTPPLKSKT